MKMLFLLHWTICWKNFLIKRFFKIKNSFTNKKKLKLKRRIKGWKQLKFKKRISIQGKKNKISTSPVVYNIYGVQLSIISME